MRLQLCIIEAQDHYHCVQCRKLGRSRTIVIDHQVDSNKPQHPAHPTYTKNLANAKVSAWQPWYLGHNSLNHPSLAFFTVTPSTTNI